MILNMEKLNTTLDFWTKDAVQRSIQCKLRCLHNANDKQ